MLVGAKRSLLKPPANAWTPASLTDSIWFDATDQTTLSLSGSDVASWSHKGSFGTARTLSEATNRPTWTDNSGDSYLTFNGTNDILWMNSTFFGSPMGNLSGVSVFIKGTFPTNISKIMLAEGASATDTPFFTVWTTAGSGDNDVTGYARNDSNNVFIANSTIAVPNVLDTTEHYWGLVFDNGTDTEVTGYLDGVAQTPVNYAAAVGTSTTNRASIGALYRTTQSNFCAITQLKQIVMVPTELTGADLASLNSWLADA